MLVVTGVYKAVNRVASIRAGAASGSILHASREARIATLRLRLTLLDFLAQRARINQAVDIRWAIRLHLDADAVLAHGARGAEDEGAGIEREADAVFVGTRTVH